MNEALTPSWTRAFQVCSSFLMSLRKECPLSADLPGPGLLTRGEPAPRGPWATSVAIVTAWPGSPGLEELGPPPSCPRFLLASPTSTAPGGPKKGMKPSPPWVQTA